MKKLKNILVWMLYVVRLGRPKANLWYQMVTCPDDEYVELDATPYLCREDSHAPHEVRVIQQTAEEAEQAEQTAKSLRHSPAYQEFYDAIMG